MPRAKEIRNQQGAFYGIEFTCPGCGHVHVMPTKNGLRGAAGWDWNGSLDTPTLSPSLLSHEVKRDDGTIVMARCHSFVRDGRIEFLEDCGHALAGQTVDLPNVD